MISLAPPTDPAAVAAATRAGRAAAVQERWHRGEPADALAALAADPDLAADRPLALELAYEEYCLRRDAGAPVDPGRFAARFPFAASLLRLVAVHSLLDRHPELLPGGRPAVRYRPGAELGDYLVVRPLGDGGFADVYLARDLSTGGRAVVLKVSARNGGEADTLGRLAHPHLMPVWSAPLVGAERVLVMPFLGVATVEDLIPPTAAGRAARPPKTRVPDRAASARRPDDPAYTPAAHPFALPGGSYERDVLAVAGGVASALAHLHANGVAHRDVKPSNILLGPTGHPYLLDLNLAEESTGAYRLGGTVPYLAPEALAAHAAAGPPPSRDWAAADVYSLGVVLWELLAGRHPYLCGSEFGPAADPEQMIRRVADRQAAPLRTVRRPRVSRAVWAAVKRCLSADPAERPRAADLARLFTPRPRRRWPAAAAVGGVLAVAATAAWTALPADRPAVVQGPAAGPFERGVLFCEQGQPDLAAVAFMEAGRGGDGRAYACAAYCHARLTTIPKALACVTLAEEAGYAGPDLDVTRAYCHMRSNDLPAALTACDRAITRDSNCRAARLTRAMVRIRQCEKDEVPPDRGVLADLEVVTAGPTSGDVWLLVAEVCIRQPDRTDADRDRAVDAVRQAIHRGYGRSRVKRAGLFDSGLRDHPQYEDALNDSKRVPATQENLHLISPIHD